MSAKQSDAKAPSKVAAKAGAQRTKATAKAAPKAGMQPVKNQHFEVRLVRSGAGRSESQRKTLLGLGLKRVGKTVYLKDTLPIRGMLYKVGYLLSVVPKVGAPPPSNREKARIFAKTNKVGKAKPAASASAAAAKQVL